VLLWHLVDSELGTQLGGLRGGTAEVVAFDQANRGVIAREYAWVADAPVDGVVILSGELRTTIASVRIRHGGVPAGRFKWRADGVLGARVGGRRWTVRLAT